MKVQKHSISTVDEYIGKFSVQQQRQLKKMRSLVKKSAPGTEEAISYQMPTYRLNKKNLVHFAAYDHHIGFYPTPSAIEAFEKELSGYKTSKGAVQFPLEEPLPEKLIRDIVAFRMTLEKT